MMTKQLYFESEGEYLDKNPNWHTEDSAWKARQILNMLEKHNLMPKSIVEIGCGAGEILVQLQQQVNDPSVHYYGYEIAPDAFAMCKSRANEQLEFFHRDLLKEDRFFDLLLMIDVFEHVEDYFGFIRESGKKATFKIYHIPLDLSVSSLMRHKLIHAREKVGHIHYFTKDTALSTIRDTGQQIIDCFYTPGAFHNNKKLRTKVLNIPRKVLYQANPDFAVRLMGGYSLLVLAK